MVCYKFKLPCLSAVFLLWGFFFFLFKPGSSTPTLEHLMLTQLFWQQEAFTLKQLNP